MSPIQTHITSSPLPQGLSDFWSDPLPQMLCMHLQSALVICHLVSDLKYISIKAQSHRSDPGLKVSFKGTINPQSTSRFSTANMKSKLTLITFILHVPGFIVTDSLVHIIPTKNKNTFLMTSPLIIRLEQIHNCFVQNSKLLLLFCSISC